MREVERGRREEAEERGGDRGASPPLADGLAGRKKREEGGAALEREGESGGCQGEGREKRVEKLGIWFFFGVEKIRDLITTVDLI